MARKKTVTKEDKILEEKFEEILDSVDAGKPSVIPASLPEANIAAGKKSEGLDSNRALKLQIIDQIEKINNRYYLLIIKKYIDNLGG